ncbi:MAG TPA: type II secretion system F family protein [Mycobacteriales bacterium]|nr:type II secretion system F family protein [Mycobacteriales bacterium]
MSAFLTGAALGLTGSGGLVLAVTSSPPLRRPRLHHRLAPYLRDAPRRSRLLDEPLHPTLLPPLQRILAPTLVRLAHRLDAFVGGGASVRRRLDRCGNRLTVEQFRIEQVIYGAASAFAALTLFALAMARGSRVNPVVAVVSACSIAAGGALARDRALTVAADRREERMLQEFPTIAELLALAVAAGEGAVGSLERVTRLTTGELAAELRRALADARAGASLVVALDAMARRSGVAALSRFVDGMAIAIDRGTPLADVLRAQAVDVREEHRRRLLEVGGRKEIAMLVPVVFLVLPVTVVFALFPGFYNLSLSVP